MKILVPTCNQYIKYVEALQYSMSIHSELDSFEKVILGYDEPNFKLENNWSFYKLHKTQRGANKWSDDILSYLSQLEDKHFIYANDDCAISFFDSEKLNNAIEFVRKNKDVGRFALMREGINRPMFDYSNDNGIKINVFSSHSNYLLSLGWSIYNKNFFMQYCHGGMDLWDFEKSSCSAEVKKDISSKWKVCTYTPEHCIDAAFFRRKNINKVIDDWDRGYYGNDLHGELKQRVKQIIMK